MTPMPPMRTDNAFRFELTIPGETRYLAFLRGVVRDTAEALGPELFPKKNILPVTIALVEAFNNAVFHAHQKRSRPVTIRFHLDGRQIRLEVVDKGRGFKETQGEPDLLASHGRGLVLMRSLMTAVEGHVDDEGHTLVLVLEK